MHLGDGTCWDAERWRDGRGRRVRGLPAPEMVTARQLRLAGLEPGPGPASGLPTTRVVLASAHLDHGPGNNRPRNQAALRQRCHMLHDAKEHRRTRWRKRFARRAAGDLLR